jgi:hypothetical protein
LVIANHNQFLFTFFLQQVLCETLGAAADSSEGVFFSDLSPPTVCPKYNSIASHPFSLSSCPYRNLARLHNARPLDDEYTFPNDLG